MRNYLTASAAAQYHVSQCFVNKTTNNIDYKKLWEFLCTCQLYWNSCASFQKVTLMQILTMKDTEFTSKHLIKITDCQDTLHAGQNAQHQHNVAVLTDTTGHSHNDISTTLSALDDHAHPDELALETANLAQPPSACCVQVLQADGTYCTCSSKHWTAFHPGPCPQQALTSCKGDGTHCIPHASDCPN